MAKVDLLNPYIYIPNFLKIRTKAGSIEPFKPNKPQTRLLNTIMEQRKKNKPVRIIILKARQMGFSTMTEAVCFHDTVTNKYRKSLIIAHEDQASQNLFNMFKTYYFNLPEALMPMRKKNNSQELVFENPTLDDIERRRNPGLLSSIKVATAGNKGAGRSDTIHFLHASEVAFWQDAKVTVTGLFQTVPSLPTTTIILESTANGVGGYFYETWKGAVNGDNDFIPLFFAWFEEPNYKIEFDNEEEKEEFIKEVNHVYKDITGVEIHTEEYELMQMFPEITYEQLKWRRWCIKNNCYGDVEKFHQEYPAYPDEAFIASGRPRFDTSALKKYRMATKEPIAQGFFHDDGLSVRIEPNKSGYISIWKEPEPNKFYTIGADVAEGTIDGDYSNAYVLDDNCDVVARWRGRIDPDIYGEELVKLAKYYNEAYLGVESNNHGLTTIKAIQRKEYHNLYYTKTHDKITDQITQKVGWRTDLRTKPLMIDKMAEFIRKRQIGIPDLELINECLTYVIDDKGSTNAQVGCHDDTVMSVAIALMLYCEGLHDISEAYVPSEYNKRRVNKEFGFEEDEDEDNPFIGFGLEISI